jgi:hypothetical protein
MRDVAASPSSPSQDQSARNMHCGSTRPACNGDGVHFDLTGEPYCDSRDGCGDMASDGSRPAVLSHGEPTPGSDRGFKTGDTVRLKDRYHGGTIRLETRYTPTDGRGLVFHFHGDALSRVAASRLEAGVVA